MKKFAVVVMVCALAVAFSSVAFADSLKLEDLGKLVGTTEGRFRYTYDPEARVFNFGGSGAPMKDMLFSAGTVEEYNGGDGMSPIIGQGHENRVTIMKWNGGWVRLTPKGDAIMRRAMSGGETGTTQVTPEMRDAWKNSGDFKSRWDAMIDEMVLESGIAAPVPAQPAASTQGILLVFPDGGQDVVPADTQFDQTPNGEMVIIFNSGELAGQSFLLPKGTQIGTAPAAQPLPGYFPQQPAPQAPQAPVVLPAPVPAPAPAPAPAKPATLNSKAAFESVFGPATACPGGFAFNAGMDASVTVSKVKFVDTPQGRLSPKDGETITIFAGPFTVYFR